MELKVRKVGNGYGVLLPKQLMEEMRIKEDSVLSIQKAGDVYEISAYDPEFARALKAFRDTESQHRNTYRELAK